MENRKLVGAIIPAIVWGFLLLPYHAFAYHTSTHQLFTQQTIDVYNATHTNQLSTELIPYIIDGARREDDPPRFLNHFYDPIYNTGLTRNAAIDPGYYLGTFPNAKEWAQQESHQNKIQYSPVIATALSSIQHKTIEKFLPTSNFTWDQALRYWVAGDREMAMFALGHILHIAQDLAVPAHTRNDPHMSGDPYEDWAQEKGQMMLSEINTSIEKASSLDEHFTTIATFSNNNFYSNDTIGIQSGYGQPQPETEDLIGEYSFGIKNGYKLYIKNKESILNITSEKSKISLKINKAGGDIVLQDYFSLLAPKAIGHGAGIIELFFEEAMAKENDPDFVPKKSLLGKIIDAAKQVFDGLLGKKEDKKSITITTTPSPQSSSNQSATQSAQQSTPPTQSYSEQSAPPSTKTTQSFTVIRVIDGDTVVLNNGDTVRYIGVNAPELNEECYAEQSKQLNESLVLNKQVVLISDGEDKDHFRRLLRYVSVGNTLVNEAIIQEGAGRAFNFNIYHSKQSAFATAEQTAKKNAKGLWGDACSVPEKEEVKKEEKKTISSPIACSFATNQSPSHAPVIINEVAWMGTQEDANNEWIELKNITTNTVDITGWTIVDEKEQIATVLGTQTPATISAGGLFILERTDDDTLPSITADAIYSGGLSNTKEGLRLFNKNCQLIDAVMADPTWPAGNATERKTMERESSLVWHTSQQSGGTPNRQNGAALSSSSSTNSSQTDATGGGGSGGGNGGGGSTQPQPEFIAVKINEIMYDLDGSDEGREWIELYNADTKNADITQWKFNENGANHGLEIIQGSAILTSGSYAVIADDPQAFLVDWPEYNGTLINSAFSLNNEGETIGIVNQTLLIHSVSYTATQGANDNGNSLQWFEGGWEEAIPTPGQENQHNQRVEEEEEDQSATTVNHILISEMQVAGELPDDEFIELYNPTDSPINLNGYSIQYISGQATSTATIYKNNVANITVAPHSFALATQQESTYAPKADILYSQFSLSGIATGATIALVSTTTPIESTHDSYIIDMLSYGKVAHQTPFTIPLPEQSTSIERKALVDGICKNPTDPAYEFQGNGCDTNTKTDFVTRAIPLPQNTSNLPEPRQAPQPPENLQMSYDADTVTILLSWNYDQENPYQFAILQNPLESPITLATTEQLSTSIRINEVGTEYTIGVQAQDEEGLGSEPIHETLTIPSFVDSIALYPDSEQEGIFIMDIRTSKTPFIPDVFNQDNRWKQVSAFINAEAPKEVPTYEPWEPTDPSTATMIYPRVGSPVARKGVMIPDPETLREPTGGAYNIALSDWSYPNGIRVTIDARNHGNFNGSLIDQNYLTLAFYATESLMPSDGRAPYLGLVATDKTHYFFSSTPPPSSPPTQPQNLSTTLQSRETDPNLLVVWDDSTDPDSAPQDIHYEMNYHHESETFDEQAWQPTYKGYRVDESIRTQVAPTISTSQQGTYYIYIRAYDEMESRSDTASTTADVSFPIAIMDTAATGSGHDHESFASDGSHDTSRIAQSFTTDTPATIELIQLALERMPEAPFSPYQVTVSIQEAQQTEEGIVPSGTALWSTTVEEDAMRTYSSGNPTIYSITPNLTISTGEYFLVLETTSNPPNRYILSYRKGNLYANGFLFKQQRSGTWNSTEYDLYCTIKVTPQ